jgi:hypothetical protein
VSPFRRALAAASIAVAAAGAGLLITAAVAVPAYASAPASAPPAGSHKITITAHPRAHAASDIGPHVILPCAVKPGVTPASCGGGAPTITCEISADTPSLDDETGDILLVAGAVTICDHPVTAIDMDETLLTPQRNIPDDSSHTVNTVFGSTFIQAGCQTGVLSTIATAEITFPAGYVVVAGTNPIRDISDSVTIHSSDCNPVVGGGGGGGGGGGCAIPAPSQAGHPAGRHPDLISCG